MKSVSFSDLSKSFELQMSETGSNIDANDRNGSNDKYGKFNGESSTNLERSSSRNSLNMKNLTHYTSSDDILKKFSSTKYSYDKYKSGNNQKSETDSNISSFTETEITVKQPKEEIPRNYDKNQFIQDLKDQVKLKDTTISKLQDDLVQEKNRYERLRENCNIQESRIQYLEHMVSAFGNDKNNKPNENVLQENRKIIEMNEEKENRYDNNSAIPRNSHISLHNNYHSNQFNQDVINKNSIPVTNDFSQQFKQSFINNNNDNNNNNNSHSNNGRFISSSNDMKYRPNSADGSLYLNSTINSPVLSGNNKKWSNGYHDNQSYGNMSTSVGYRMNQSDSEDYESPMRYSSHLDNRDEMPRRQGSPTKDFISRHRQKLDRDRSMNLADFRNKLEEFSKMAQKTTERNTITGSSNHHAGYSQYNKINHSPQVLYSTDNKRYNSSGNFNDASRPPIHPHHKMVSPNRKTYTNVSQTNSTSHSNKYQPHKDYPCLEMSKEDEKLKERVKQILEKNNYSTPLNSTNTYNANIHNSVPALSSSPTKQLHYDSSYQMYNDESAAYHSGSQHEINGTNAMEPPSNIPKRTGYSSELDPETSSLLDKYLNTSTYQ